MDGFVYVLGTKNGDTRIYDPEEGTDPRSVYRVMLYKIPVFNAVSDCATEVCW